MNPIRTAQTRLLLVPSELLEKAGQLGCHLQLDTSSSCTQLWRLGGVFTAFFSPSSLAGSRPRHLRPAPLPSRSVALLHITEEGTDLWRSATDKSLDS